MFSCNICCCVYDYIYEVIDCEFCNYQQCKNCIMQYYNLHNLDVPKCLSCFASIYVNDLSVISKLKQIVDNHKNDELFVQYKINKYEQISRLTDNEKIKFIAKVTSDFLQQNFNLTKSEDKTQLWKLGNLNIIVCRCKCGSIVYGNYFCRKCNKTICRWCHDYSHNNKCDDNLLKSRELLESYTTCMNCGIIIEKDGGCSEIKCINCGVKFDANSGSIITDDRLFHDPYNTTSRIDLAMSNISRYIVMNVDKQFLKKHKNLDNIITFDYDRFVDNNPHICDNLSNIDSQFARYSMLLYSLLQLLIDCKYFSKRIYLSILSNFNFSLEYIYTFIVNYDNFDFTIIDNLLNTIITFIEEFINFDAIHTIDFTYNTFLSTLVSIHEKLKSYTPKIINIRFIKSYKNPSIKTITNFIDKYKYELQSV